VRDQLRAFERGDRLQRQRVRWPQNAKRLVESAHVLGRLCQTLLDHRRVTVPGQIARNCAGRLSFQTRGLTGPEQFRKVGRVDDGLRVAPVLRAGIPARETTSIAPAETRIVARRAACAHIARQPVVEKQEPAKGDFRRRDRIVTRHRDVRKRRQWASGRLEIGWLIECNVGRGTVVVLVVVSTVRPAVGARRRTVLGRLGTLRLLAGRAAAHAQRDNQHRRSQRPLIPNTHTASSFRVRGVGRAGSRPVRRPEDCRRAC